MYYLRQLSVSESAAATQYYFLFFRYFEQFSKKSEKSIRDKFISKIHQRYST
jgi:hypothetical protein